MWQYSTCAGQRASYQWIKAKIHNPESGKNQTMMRTGECIEQNVAVESPPFHRCCGYDFWADDGAADDNTCFFPFIHAMKEIYEAYP